MLPLPNRKTLPVIITVFCAAAGIVAAALGCAAPELSLLGEDKVELAYGEHYVEQGAYAVSPGTGEELSVEISGGVDPYSPGVTTITYRTEARGQSAEVTRTVTVAEPESPPADEAAAAEPEAAETAEEPAAAEFPRFELLGEEELEWPCGRFFEEPGFIALDSEGQDISARVSIEGEIKLWLPGEYSIEYTLKHEDGSQSSLSRTVKLIPAELPETVPTEKTVYLTFDDGPCQYTMKVLDLLDKYDAKATFFVIDCGNPYFDLVKEIAARGHAIGVHSFSHDISKIYNSEEAFFNDFLLLQQRIYELTGQYAPVSRFPGGSATATAYAKAHVEGGFETLEQGLANMGVRYYDWNIQTESNDNNPTESFNRFKRGVPGFKTPISLQHDPSLFSVNALESILQWCVENGYSFGVIDGSTPEVHSDSLEGS